ncbi:MAG TPA: hemerythrin domain-containing protein [Steroidobacter sp.]|nr:hemerythrin domain-containing protein [Steroidobacter sp.]
MARATSQSASDAPRDAVALLKQDHRTVETLFSEFENAEESEQSSIAEKVCQLLTVHAQIEEEILYPAAREALADDEEEADLVLEAQVEHNTAKELIAKIETMTPDDEEFRATVKVLGEYVKHHVKEEENELFPAMRKAKVDLKELGAQLGERKFGLMEELGIAPTETPAQPRKRAAAGRAKSSTRSRQARAGARKSTRGSTGRAARH